MKTGVCLLEKRELAGKDAGAPRGRDWALLVLSRCALAALTGLVLSGCLFKPVTVATRHFILSPISTNEPAPIAKEQLPIGIGFVKMPAYLLRSSMAVRNGDNEIEYLEDARWGERLDQCFQRTLAANLSLLLPSDTVYLTDWARDQVKVQLSITVQQFDVDTRGRGTLTAQWRISGPDSDKPMKSGQTRLVRTGSPPHGKPEVIAETLSDLAAEFSRDLAQAIGELVKSGH
jgi:uncharacterized lipoprotein YmbA